MGVDRPNRETLQLERTAVSSGGWNRLTNGQREDLSKLQVWTTEEDRIAALSYVHQRLEGVEKALSAVRAGQPAPLNLGELVAVARYESAGWMPDGNFDRWRRWGFFRNSVERMSAADLVTWLEDAEQQMRQGRPYPYEDDK